MDEIRIVAQDWIREECLDDWKKLAKEFIEATNEKDEGCIEFNMLQDNKDQTHFCYVERWENLDLVLKHIAQPHFQHFKAERAKMQIKPTESTRYHVYDLES